MECEIKLEGPASPDVELGKEETEESKKRKRKPYRPGEALEWWCRAVKGSPQALVAAHSWLVFAHRHRGFHDPAAEVSYPSEEGTCCTGGRIEWGRAARRG